MLRLTLPARRRPAVAAAAVRAPSCAEVSSVYRHVTGGRVRDPFAPAVSILASAAVRHAHERDMDRLGIVADLFDAGHVDAARFVAEQYGLWHHHLDPQDTP